MRGSYGRHATLPMTDGGVKVETGMYNGCRATTEGKSSLL